jgi:hypothetical protein
MAIAELKLGIHSRLIDLLQDGELAHLLVLIQRTIEEVLGGKPTSMVPRMLQESQS